MDTPPTAQTVDTWNQSGERHTSLATDLSPQMWWDPTQPDLAMNATYPSYGFEHLNELEDIFAFTGATLPPEPPINLETAYGQQIPNLVSEVPPTNLHHDRVINLSSTQTFGIPQADEQFLRDQGCFQLPPTQVFREMMLLYFRIVHANLPVVFENEFWALWGSDGFHLGACSLLVVSAMIYTTCSVSRTNPRVPHAAY